MTAPIPMSVLGGFLGAGKTTLLNRILSGSHAVRYAVLVNDFGELAVDGDLVAAHDGETVTFANGCVCCSIGDDLVDTLDRLLDGDRPPEHILVEASGVADPRAIADVATLHPGLSRDLVVVLADVETVHVRHEDLRLRDTVARQLASADLLVLNKCDLAADDEIERVESWARGLSRAPAIRSVGADIPMELLSGVRLEALAPRTDDGSPVPATHEHAPDHAHRFSARLVPCPDPLDPVRLRAALSALSPRVLRAKGFVLARNGPEREWLLVQAIGRTVDIDRRPPSPARGPPAPGIVFIGLGDLPDTETLAGAVHRATGPATRS